MVETLHFRYGISFAARGVETLPTFSMLTNSINPIKVAVPAAECITHFQPKREMFFTTTTARSTWIERLRRRTQIS